MRIRHDAYFTMPCCQVENIPDFSLFLLSLFCHWSFCNLIASSEPSATSSRPRVLCADITSRVGWNSGSSWPTEKILSMLHHLVTTHLTIRSWYYGLQLVALLKIAFTHHFALLRTDVKLFFLYILRCGDVDTIWAFHLTCGLGALAGGMLSVFLTRFDSGSSLYSPNCSLGLSCALCDYCR